MKIVNDWNGWQRGCSCICSPQTSLFEGWSVGISPSIHEHEVDPNIYIYTIYTIPNQQKKLMNKDEKRINKE
jgi:hypothetical protein